MPNDYITILKFKDLIYYYNTFKGLYKVKKDGTSKTKICSDNAREIMVIGDCIYYGNDSDKGKLYKIKVDGTDRTKINDDASYRINFSGKKSSLFIYGL